MLLVSISGFVGDLVYQFSLEGDEYIRVGVCCHVVDLLFLFRVSLPTAGDDQKSTWIHHRKSCVVDVSDFRMIFKLSKRRVNRLLSFLLVFFQPIVSFIQIVSVGTAREYGYSPTPAHSAWANII